MATRVVSLNALSAELAPRFQHIHHPDCDDATAHLFVQFDALCPYLTTSAIASVLRKSDIPCPFVTNWTAWAVRKMRSGLPDLYDGDEDEMDAMDAMDAQERHIINSGLDKNSDIVKLLVQNIAAVSQDDEVDLEEIYLYIYYGTDINIYGPEQIEDIEDVCDVISTTFSDIKIDPDWLYSLSESRNALILRTFAIDMLQCKIWHSAKEILHGPLPKRKIYMYSIVRLLAGQSIDYAESLPMGQPCWMEYDALCRRTMQRQMKNLQKHRNCCVRKWRMNLHNLRALRACSALWPALPQSHAWMN